MSTSSVLSLSVCKIWHLSSYLLPHSLLFRPVLRLYQVFSAPPVLSWLITMTHPWSTLMSAMQPGADTTCCCLTRLNMRRNYKHKQSERKAEMNSLFFNHCALVCRERSSKWSNGKWLISYSSRWASMVALLVGSQRRVKFSLMPAGGGSAISSLIKVRFGINQ